MPGLGSSDTTLASVGSRHVSRTVRVTGVFRDQIVRCWLLLSFREKLMLIFR
jgi:hypothetical protein